MKKFLVIMLTFCSLFAYPQSKLVDFVQPFCGTAPSTTFSAKLHAEGTENLANTIPAATLPFAMTQWTPQTRAGEAKCNAPFYYNDVFFSGIRGTHWLSGSCVPDYGSLTIMPTSGKLKTKLVDYQTSRDTTAEIAKPYYYAIKLAKYKLRTEVAPTARCSVMQFSSDRDTAINILIVPNNDNGEAFVKINKVTNTIYGYNPARRIYQGWGKPAGFSGYFVIQFDRKISASGVFVDDAILEQDSIVNRKNLGAFVSFKIKRDEKVKIKIGTSFTGFGAAHANLKSEIPDWDFEAVKATAENTWERSLSTIVVKGNSVKDKDIFYTAMYHAMLHPRLASDVDGSYTKFDHQYEVAKMEKGNYYDDFPMWDIFRAQLPLLQIIKPEIINDLVRSMVLKAQQGKWLPIFPCWANYTSAMIGDHVIPFIASSYLKGFKDYDVEEAYKYMRKNAYETPDSASYADGKGRRALTSYLKYKYVPLEDSVWQAFHKREQVSRTLEYAFDDYGLAQMAKALNKTADFKDLKSRGKNYRNVYDQTRGFMNGRYANGDFYKDLDPDKKMFFITEGTPRQYSFFVPHDVDGLAKLMGGKMALETALDSLFIKNQYWHGNEPSHQIAFMYNHTKSPFKTQGAVRKILAEEYDNGKGGLSGNDDAGQMSAWYIFASMGLYPLDPVSGKFEISSPLFDEVVINRPEGKPFSIYTTKTTTESFYIKNIKFNGKNNYRKWTIDYRDIMNGGEINYTLTKKPSN